MIFGLVAPNYGLKARLVSRGRSASLPRVLSTRRAWLARNSRRRPPEAREPEPALACKPDAGSGARDAPPVPRRRNARREARRDDRRWSANRAFDRACLRRSAAPAPDGPLPCATLRPDVAWRG